ncbi:MULTISPECIES: molybdenum cofactor biosynthesis protein MoaE [unclassified Alteromonas]|uniref:molybdenum cofactor biosynthesis protein MoaE n=1 Tax=unclassified Alteromonas TaxID=2614992 RepID=UPI000509CFAA|nr:MULTISPECIES: molybdenum cofactor biosynthesis protein MoaE [unclassified Alteromonas]
MFAYIQEQDFDQGDLYAQLQSQTQAKTLGNTGAIVTFTGLVRDFNNAGNIDGIELEHYPGMTEKALSILIDKAIERFSLTNAGAVHRVGRIYNNEQIVWVGCAATHRQAAFDGACFLMDMLKQSVPLWKKEFKGDKSTWVEAKGSDDAAALKWMSER